MDYKILPLADVAGKTKVMPDEFINTKANGVTDKFKFYLRPLLGSGLAATHRLRAPKVSRISL